MNDIPNKVTQYKKICYVKSGTPPLKRTASKSGILFLANDWKIVTDVVAFRIQIALTALCPGILIYSPSLTYYYRIDLSM